MYGGAGRHDRRDTSDPSMGRYEAAADDPFMLPMTADGFLQLFTSYESKNDRRFATGVLFGLAFDSLLIHFHRACVMAAGWIVKLFIEDSGAVERAMELFL